MKLQFTVTAADYAEAFSLHRPDFSPRWRSGVVVAAVLLTLGVILLVFSLLIVTSGEPRQELQLWGGVSVSIGFVSLVWLLRERQVLQELWPRLAAAHQPIELTADQSGLHQRTKSFSAQAEWAYYIASRESPRLFLLYFNREQYVLIPKRAFASTDDIESFRRLATPQADAS